MIATWGLLYALTPIGQLPVIELMNYQPTIGISDCVNQAKPYWADYFNKANKSNIQLTTYCFKKKRNDVQFFDITCSQGGGCDYRPK